MKEITIEIPDNINGFRIAHFNALKALDEIKNPLRVNIRQKLKICSEFTGVPQDELEHYTPLSIEALFTQLMKTLDTYHPRLVPTQVKYGDQVYEFIGDMKRLPVAWFIDVSVTDFEKHPERLASFCYIEHGMQYAERDDNLNILNPLGERDKVFAEEMPLNRYIDLSGFFLTLYLKLMPSLTKTGTPVNQQMRKLEADLNRMRGIIQSMKSQRNIE